MIKSMLLVSAVTVVLWMPAQVCPAEPPAKAEKSEMVKYMEGLFQKKKTAMLKNVDDKIDALKKSRECIEAASTPRELKQCRKLKR